jgi:hypothetical protein
MRNGLADERGRVRHWRAILGFAVGQVNEGHEHGIVTKSFLRGSHKNWIRFAGGVAPFHGLFVSGTDSDHATLVAREGYHEFKGADRRAWLRGYSSGACMPPLYGRASHPPRRFGEESLGVKLREKLHNKFFVFFDSAISLRIFCLRIDGCNLL